MYIPRLYRFLSIDDKMELLCLLNNDEEVIYKKDNINIKDWLDTMSIKDISVRLFNCLRTLSNSRNWNESSKRGIYDLEKIDIMTMENSGKVSWIEFEKLRENYKNSIKK
jgi:hypothetical protein